MTIERELGEISATLKSIDDHLETLNGRTGRTEDRVAALEKGWAGATAVFSVFSAIIGAVFSKIQL